MGVKKRFGTVLFIKRYLNFCEVSNKVLVLFYVYFKLAAVEDKKKTMNAGETHFYHIET